MAELRATFEKGRRPGLADVIITEWDSNKKFYPRYTDHKPTDLAYEEFQTHTGFPEAVEIGDGEEVQWQDRLAGYSKTGKPEQFNAAWKISELGEETIQYAALKRDVPLLVRALLHAMEKHSANVVFNNGFGSTTTADGQFLFDTDHTLKGTGGTFANEPAAGSALSPASLQDLMTRLDNTVGDWNLPMPQLDGDKTLWIPTALRWTAMEILESVGRAYTADNTKNVIDNITAVVCHYITSTTAFFLFGPRKYIPFLQHGGVRQRMDFDENSHMNKYQVYSFFKCIAVDWRSLVANPGA